MRWNAFRGRIFGSSLCFLLVFAGVLQAGEPAEKGHAANERRVSREEFDEAYWGVRLEEIDDEVVKKKGDETLFINAAGEIFIRKVGAGYAGETGKSYSSTEEMLLQEGRWEELSAYTQGASRNTTPSLPRARSSSGPRIVLSARSSRVDFGQTLVVRVRLQSVEWQEESTVGLSLGYDPSLIAFAGASGVEGARVVEQRARKLHSERAIVRLRLERGGGERPASDGVALLRFDTIGKGSGVIEPLSVEASAGPGKTFVRTASRLFAPQIGPIRVEVR